MSLFFDVLHQIKLEFIMNEQLKMIYANPNPNWLKQNNGNNIETFLITDLSETSLPIIDKNQIRSETYIFDYPCLVQINEIVDIGIPYSRRINFETDEKGTLKFLLDDGFNTFIGISKHKMKILNPLLTPGIKIVILKGTIAKYGVVFLDDEHIQIIGGKSTIKTEKRKNIVQYNPKLYQTQQPKKEIKKTQRQNTTKKKTQTKKNSTKQNPTLKLIEEPINKTQFLSSDESDFEYIENDNTNEQQNKINIMQIKELINKSESDKISFIELKNCKVKSYGTLSIAKNKGNVYYYSMNCIISDGKNRLILKISPLLIERMIGYKPENWIQMERTDQNTIFLNMKTTISKLSPIILIDTGKGNSTERFFLCSEEYVKDII